MPISPYYGDNYLGLNTGASAFVGTNVIHDPAGYTFYIQYFQPTFGLSGSYNPVSDSSPFPVTVVNGLTATISGITGTVTIQGTPSGTAVPVSGTISVTGITTSPVPVYTPPGCRVEITGGQRLSKSNDSVSVFGPNGITWLYAQIVNGSGTLIGTSASPMYVSFSGVTITGTIASTVGVTNDGATSALRIQGLSGGTSVAVTVGNTVGINDTAILASLAGICSSLTTLNSNISAISGVVPTGITGGRMTSTTTYGQMDSGGYTCSAGVHVKASTINTDLVYLNNSGISSSGIGYELDPGESLFINVNNTNKIYVKAKSGSQIISFLAS